MTKNSKKLVSLAALVLLSCVSMVHAEDIDRGKLLYENHCGGCHTSAIHQRDDRKSNTLVEMSKWVIRWQYHLKLGWSFEEVRQVVGYLNATYYHIGRSPSEK